MPKYRIVWAIVLSFGLLPACSHSHQNDKFYYLESGQKYLEQGQPQEAMIQFRNALQIDPNFVEGHRRLGKAYLQLQQYTEAAAALALAAEMDPRSIETHFLLGKVYLSLRNYQSAENEAEFILKRDPNNAPAYQLQAAALVGSGQKERAQELFRKITELIPNDSSSYINLAIAESALGCFEDAEKHFKKAIAIGPGSAPAYLNLANWYRQQRRLPEAEAVLREGQRNIPAYSGICINLAETLCAEGKEQLAEGVIESFRERQPKSMDTELAIANYYAAQKKWDSAEIACKRALALGPARVDVRQRLVELGLDRGDLKGAAALNDQILKDYPTDLTSHVARGRILLAEGKRDEAVAELRQQLPAAPNSPQVHYFLGLACWRSGNLNQARSAFRQAIELDPELVPALHNMAEIELSMGERQAALDLARRCVALRPSDPSERVLIGQAYLATADFVQAREQFTSAQELAPDDPAIRVCLALCSVGEHKLDQAKSELDKAMQMDLEFIPALTLLVDLEVRTNLRSKAVDRMKTFLGQYPNNAQGHLILGSLYAKGAEYAMAQTEFERAIRIDPNLLAAYLELGKTYQQAGQLDLAIDRYHSALTLQPGFPPLITLVGNLYLEKGDLASARKCFEQALSVNSDFAVAGSNLAWVYAQQGVKLDVALDLARKAAQQLPELDSVIDTLGWVEYQNGQFSSAVPLFQQCVQKAPNHPVYRYHLGMALVASGQKEKGQMELGAALHLNLAGAEALQARQTAQLH